MLSLYSWLLFPVSVLSLCSCFATYVILSVLLNSVCCPFVSCSATSPKSPSCRSFSVSVITGLPDALLSALSASLSDIPSCVLSQAGVICPWSRCVVISRCGVFLSSSAMIRVFSSRFVVLLMRSYVSHSCLYSILSVYIALSFLIVRLLGWLLYSCCMVNIIEAVFSRRSVRDFRADNIPREVLSDILFAASCAPSAGDVQPWSFIIISSDQVRRSVVSACVDSSWLLRAPVLVAVVGDSARMEDFLGSSPEARVACRDSCCAAIENALLAASSFGVGSCWVSQYDSSAVSEALNVPSSHELIAVLAFGYPLGSPVEKHRTPLESLVYFDSFGESANDLLTRTRDWGEIGHNTKQSFISRIRDFFVGFDK